MKKKLFLVIIALLFLGIGVGAFTYKGAIGKQVAKCCACCCGDSCPMKNKDAASVKDTASMDAKSCCDNCDCCKGDNCPMKTKGETAESIVMPALQTAAGDAKTCDCSCCHGKNPKTQT